VRPSTYPRVSNRGKGTQKLARDVSAVRRCQSNAFAQAYPTSGDRGKIGERLARGPKRTAP
jgi:hypothetical protein